MFKVTETEFAVILESDTCKAEIWPSCGGILNQWQVQLHQKVWDIIDGYDSLPDFADNCEEKGFRSCKLSPYVCRLNHATYRFNGKQFNIGKFMLGDHAIHGLLYNSVFTVENSGADSASAMVSLQHQYDGSDIGYPFKYSLNVNYTLQANNQLGITTTLVNNGSETMPIADGWHPYFALGRTVNDLHFSMASNNMVEFNEGLIPTGELLTNSRFLEETLLGETFLNNCFVLQKPLNGPACTLTNYTDRIRLTIDADDQYPFLQVYTPPHRNSIAIENLSSAPDAFNNHMGLIMLEPGESHSFSCKYSVSEV